MVIRLLTSKKPAIMLLVFCCLVFMLLNFIPAKIRPLIIDTLLLLLGINLVFCTFNRFYLKRHKLTLRTGADLLLHLGLIIIILSGFAGIWGHQATIQFREGETHNLRPQGLPITVRVDDIRAVYYTNGMPQQYFTTISIVEKGKVVQRQQISVNHPFTYQGVKIYPSTFEVIAGTKRSGLKFKTNPGLPLLWPGLVLLSSGVIVLSLRR